MVRSLLLRYAHAVRDLKILKARLALLQLARRSQMLNWLRALSHANAHGNDALGAAVTLVQRA